MIINFQNKTALVTGGTRGIGKQIAQDLEKFGAKVLITGTNLSEPDFTKTGNYSYLSCDFTDSDQVSKLINHLSNLDNIDLCVNNAGINRINEISDVKINDYTDMLKVNLEVPFLITQAISKKMIQNRTGKIINISSIYGKISREKRSVYSITKNGIHGLTVSTSIELAKYGILVNTVSPGFTLTDLTKKNLTGEEMISLSEQIPMKRMASVSEISNIVLFLLSDFNTYITGQNIIVDGGFTNV